MNKRTLAVVVVYYPDIELLRKNISSFINDVDYVLVWENMEECEASKYRIGLGSKVEYYCARENVGISKALNYAWQYAVEHNFDYILTMDQDSIWKSFSDFKQQAVNFLEENNAIVGPITRKEDGCKEKRQNFSSRKWLITSGMFVPVSVLNIIGGYNENFKIDGVDIELCLRAQSKGIETFVNNTSFLIQQYGTNSEIRLWGMCIKVQDYNPSRIRCIFWDIIVLLRVYRKKTLIKELFIFLKLVVQSSLLLRGNRIKKLQNAYVGIKEGILFPLKQYYILNRYAE